MDDLKNSKKSQLAQVAQRLEQYSEQEMTAMYNCIEQRLFEFANYMEAQLALLYTPFSSEVQHINTESIIRKSLQIEKQIILPVFSESKNAIHLYKISNYDTDLRKNSSGVLEPDTEKCKKINIDEIDIALIPGLAFDDKGGRIGFGSNYYNRLITRLPETCRKVSLAYDDQLVDQIQMESRKYTVDIIITDKKIIYKI